MHACIVYASCTGNTRKVAEALAACSGVPCFAVRHAPDPDAFDLLALGFWVRKGLPDTRSQRYMGQIQEKKVFYFGTMGAWPHSEHALRCMAAVRQMLTAGRNTVLDGFLCQGKVNPRVVNISQKKGRHVMNAQRLIRLQEAQRHPDENDLLTASLRWQSCLQQVAMATLPLHRG